MSMKTPVKIMTTLTVVLMASDVIPLKWQIAPVLHAQRMVSVKQRRVLLAIMSMLVFVKPTTTITAEQKDRNVQKKMLRLSHVPQEPALLRRVTMGINWMAVIALK